MGGADRWLTKKRRYHSNPRRYEKPYFSSGKYLSVTQTPSDVHVSIGGSPCNVTAITAEALHCTIPGDLLDRRNTSTHLVEYRIVSQKNRVRAGLLHHRLGYVEFVERGITPQTIGIVIGVVLFVCFFALVMYFYFRRVARWKQHPGYIVAYTADRQRSHRDACGGAARRQDSNDYHDWRGRSISRQTSAKQSTSAKGQPAEEEEAVAGAAARPVDEETMRLLESENILIYRNYLSLGEIIGVGHFGCVYKGELQIPEKEEKVKVAVKTLHNNAEKKAKVNKY
ncbi:UNVERIFIED_CONTAM: hypothetical protein NCL1_43810 [Trichonephila clavipes]